MTFPFTFKMEQILHNESIGLSITESLKEGDSTGRDYAWETTNLLGKKVSYQKVKTIKQGTLIREHNGKLRVTT